MNHLKTQNLTPFFFPICPDCVLIPTLAVVSGEDFDVWLCVRPVRPNAAVATVYRPAWLSTAGTAFQQVFLRQ
jgi:hypothetical protein